MGLHTWFHKDKTLYDEQTKLFEKLDACEDGKLYLDDLGQLQIHARIDQISELNDAEYHDLFRTSKRNEDGTYTDNIICSKEECYEWLKNNKHTFFHEEYRLRLDNFWAEHPNGVISFG